MSLSSWQVCVNINSVHNRYCGYNNSLKHNNIEYRHSAHTSDVSFGCGALKASSGSEIIYKQMGKLASTIDDILGKDNGVGFFSSNIEKAKKAGLKIENDSFSAACINERNIFRRKMKTDQFRKRGKMKIVQFQVKSKTI